MPILKATYITFIGIIVIILSGCSYFEHGQIQNVGMLLDGTVDEHAWNEQGYEGLLEIEEKYDTDVFYQENVVTEDDVRDAVEEFVQDGVNLIFGHSSIYGSFFQEIAASYPEVQFIYFNGGFHSDNVASLNFNTHAAGFFVGMVAGEMTNSKEVGIITSFEWQPEIEGFYEGVKFQDPSVEVHMNFLNDRNDSEESRKMYTEMRDNGVDVFYPAGNSFAEEVIMQAESDDFYAIGYVADQLELAPNTVLTSTIQHVGRLYELAAEEFNKNRLDSDLHVYDFQDELISLGQFSSNVPAEFQDYINESVEEYRQSGLLPNEK